MGAPQRDREGGIDCRVGVSLGGSGCKGVELHMSLCMWLISPPAVVFALFSFDRPYLSSHCTS